MAVALDAKSSWIAAKNLLASYTDASFTVGSGANRALVVALPVETTTGNVPTTPTANWDSTGTNQSMQLLAASTISDARHTHPTITFFFGLVAPTSGLKTLSIAGLNTLCDSFVSYISFTGADQTGGTTTFKNATTSIVGSGTSGVATITTVAGDAAIALFGGNNGSPTINQTAWAAPTLTGYATDYWISAYALAVGASTAITMTQTTAQFCFTALAINQATAAAAPILMTRRRPLLRRCHGSESLRDLLRQHSRRGDSRPIFDKGWDS